MPFTFCPLRSGSSGCVSFLRAGTTTLLVDAGHSARQIDALLASIGEKADGLDGILITHEHSDHIKGVGTLSKRYGIPVYANDATWLGMKGKPGVDSIEARNRRVFTTGEDFYIGDVNIQPFEIPHDAAAPVGYAIVYRGRKVSIATDIGHLTKQLAEVVSESDLLLLESNHDPAMLRSCDYPSWLKKRISGRLGHLSNSECSEMLVKLAMGGMRHFVLGHMSEEANMPELAHSTAADALKGTSARVDIAYRDKTGGVYEIS